MAKEKNRIRRVNNVPPRENIRKSNTFQTRFDANYRSLVPAMNVHFSKNYMNALKFTYPARSVDKMRSRVLIFRLRESLCILKLESPFGLCTRLENTKNR